MKLDTLSPLMRAFLLPNQVPRGIMPFEMIKAKYLPSSISGKQLKQSEKPAQDRTQIDFKQ